MIFYGEVTRNEVQKNEQSGHIATLTEFRIIELIKGDTGQTHTIKQMGGFHTGSKTRLHIHGVPQFQTGGKYVVFLPEKSSLGFSSPLGLHQGSFPVATINNEEIVSSGRRLDKQHAGNTTSRTGSHVQLPLAVNAENPSHSRLSDFINTVRTYQTQ